MHVTRWILCGALLLGACRDSTAPRQLTQSPDSAIGTALDLAPGEVRVFSDPVVFSGLRLPADSVAADYIFVAANANPVPDVLAQYRIAVTPATSGPAIFASRGVPAPAATLGAAPPGDPVEDAVLAAMTLQARFESRLRAWERGFTSKAAASGALSASMQFGALSSVAAAPVPLPGDTITLNVPDAEADNLCTSFFEIAGVVQAVGTHAIIVADTASPPDGFTAEDFEAIAREFDTLIFPTVTRYFGMPSDFDANEKIVILYTPRVNALTPRTPSGKDPGGFVGGFFFGGDLFPKQDASGRAICQGSNQAEIFFLLAPDPSGLFSDPRTVAAVRQGTRGTIAHEFQHMINLGVRLGQSGTRPFEVAWLNEALAHMAEDVVGRAKFGFGDFENLTYAQVTANQADFFAFFYQNLARMRIWMQRPDTAGATSRKAAGGLAARGAAWSLVRHATDHYSGSDAPSFLRRLVAGPDTGVRNLVSHTGVPFDTLMAGWMVANYADDAGLPGIAQRYTYRSYNLRSVETGLTGGIYPLRIIPLDATAGTLTASAVSGTGNYFRLRETGSTDPPVFRFLNASGTGGANFPGARLYVLRLR